VSRSPVKSTVTVNNKLTNTQIQVC